MVFTLKIDKIIDSIFAIDTSFLTLKIIDRLSAVSGPSTYPANRDFKGHVGGVRGAAPQGFFLFFSIFFEFFCQIFKEKKGDVLTNI